MNAGLRSLDFIPSEMGLSMEGFWQRQTQSLFYLLWLPPSHIPNQALHSQYSQHPRQSQNHSYWPLLSPSCLLHIWLPTFPLVCTLPGIKAPNKLWQKQNLDNDFLRVKILPQRLNCWGVYFCQTPRGPDCEISMWMTSLSALHSILVSTKESKFSLYS